MPESASMHMHIHNEFSYRIVPRVASANQNAGKISWMISLLSHDVNIRTSTPGVFAGKINVADVLSSAGTATASPLRQASERRAFLGLPQTICGFGER